MLLSLALFESSFLQIVTITFSALIISEILNISTEVTISSVSLSLLPIDLDPQIQNVNAPVSDRNDHCLFLKYRTVPQLH